MKKLTLFAVFAWPTLALAQTPSPAQSLFQQLEVSHVLAALGLALLAWAYKDLNPHLKTWLGAKKVDPKESAVVHTAATVGLMLDDVAESIAGHVLHDDGVKNAADLHEAATDLAQDAVDGLSDGAGAAAEQYLGATGKQLTDYLVGLVKKKVADAKAAGVTAAAQVTTPAKAAAAVDAATGAPK